MTTTTNAGKDDNLDPLAILIHLGLLIFGISASLTGLLADDYKKIEHLGFTIHSWFGIGLAFFAGLRLLAGIAGPRSLRFTRWLPVTAARLKLAAEDLAGLLKFRMPDRPTHRGLAGVVESFGLAVFLLMAATGVYLYLYLEPGRKAHGLVHDVKELHEIGVVLIPLFLSMHGGAVLLHALQGKHLWRKMFFISDRMEQDAQQAEALPDER